MCSGQMPQLINEQTGHAGTEGHSTSTFRPGVQRDLEKYYEQQAVLDDGLICAEGKNIKIESQRVGSS